MTKKKIPVYFTIPDEYEDWPLWKMPVGSIPADKANKFLQTVANSPRKDEDNDCVDYMDAHYESIVSIMRGENEGTPRNERKKCDIFSGEIKLSGFFDSDYITPNYHDYYEPDEDYRGDCPMCVRHKNRKRSEQNKLHVCANAIRDGKCVDPMMRKLAAMMYPEKYKEKQK